MVNTDLNLNSLGVSEILFRGSRQDGSNVPRVAVTSGMLFVSGQQLMFVRGNATLTVTIA